MIALAEGLITNLPAILEAIAQIGAAILTGLWDLAGTLLSWLGELFVSLFEKIVQFGADALNWVVTAIPNLISNIITFFSELPGKIWNWLVETIVKIANWGMQMRAKAIEAAKNFLSNLVNGIKELPGKVWNFLVSTVSKVIQFGNEMRNKAIEAARTFKDNIVNGLKELPDKMKNVGDQLVKGLWNGIKNVKDWILGKIKGFGKSVLDGIKSFFGIKSPSRKTAEIGRFLVKGLAVGLEDEREATKAAEKLSNDVLSAFNSDGLAMAVSDLPDLNTDISTSLTATGAATNEESNTDKLLMMILETLTQLDDGMKDKIKSAVDGMGFNWNDREVGRFVKTYA